MASSKVENCLKKKVTPRAQIFRCFRYESRNKEKTNKTARIRARP